jgi:DNA-binding NarL/FixJ family response regulator
MRVANEIRILVVDDHPVVRSGLKFSIAEDSDLKVVGEAGDGEAALTLIKKLRPHITLLDIDMPKLDGFGVAREITKLKLETKIIFLSLHKDEDMLRTAMDLGGNGYLLKDSAMEEIVTAVKTVMAGRPYLSSAIAMQLLQGSSETAASIEPENPLTRDLTFSERRILRLIADGKSSKEIGDELSVHYRTIENHRTNICRKLGIEGANALIRFALQHKSILDQKQN